MQQMEKFYIVSSTSCLFIGLMPVKTRGRILKFVHCILCSVHNYILYLPTIHPFMSHILMCGFRVEYCIIISVVHCVIFLSKFSYFSLLYSLLLIVAFTHAYLLAYSVEPNPPWEANRFSASQEIPLILTFRRLNFLLNFSTPCI